MENGKRRSARQLSPEEKWQLFLEVDLAAAHAGRRCPEVGRRRVGCDPDSAAGEGRGVGGVRVLEAGPGALARAGRAGGRAGGERPALGGAQGARGRAVACPGKAALGLYGPVPERVSAETKLELLGLDRQRGRRGWAHARACPVLEIADVRVHRWRARLRETGRSMTVPRSAMRCTGSCRGRSRRSSI